MAGGLAPPASVVQSWPPANYENPPLRGCAVLIATTTLAIFTFVIVTARFWSRFKLQQNAGLDDWIFLAAMPPLLSLVIGVNLITTLYGLDKHVWDLTLETVINMRKNALANCVSYILSTCLIKLSVLCFYRRLTDRIISAAFIYTVWIFMAMECIQIVVCLAILCFSCYPLAAYWYQFSSTWTSEHSYTCVPQGPALFAMSVVSVSQDFVATALPFTLFLRMKISSRQKIALSCTFAGGLVVCAVGAYRTYTIWRTYWLTYDVTWSAYDFEGSSSAEVLLAAIFASAPALKYYLRDFLDEKVDRKDRGGSSADPFLSNSSDDTTLCTATKTRLDSEANEMDFWAVLDPFGEKKKASMAMLTPRCDEQLPGWHGRTPSAQEMELIAEGIISADGPESYFDKSTKRIVTHEVNPMKYAWAED